MLGYMWSLYHIPNIITPANNAKPIPLFVFVGNSSTPDVAIAALTALWVAMGRSFGRISGIVMCAVYVAYIFIQYI